MTDAVTALADRVAELVELHWREHGDPLLLSQLGSADQGEVGKSAKKLSINLAEFVRQHVKDRVRIVSGSTHPPVMLAMPANIENDVDVDALLARKREHSIARGPRFHPAFWAAFRVPLDEKNRRFVSTHAPPRFEDTPLVEYKRAGFIEVERQYIGSDDGDVQQQISDWLDTNGLDREMYLAVPRASSDLPPNDLLGRLLVSLEPDELKRMSIPLDVVSKLRRQPL